MRGIVVVEHVAEDVRERGAVDLRELDSAFGNTRIEAGLRDAARLDLARRNRG